MVAKFTFLDERGLLSVSGAEARSFLQGLISNDVDKVTESMSIYAALLTAQGKFLHDFFVMPWGDGLLIDCEGGRRADLLRRLTLYKLRSKVTLGDETEHLAVAAVFGDRLTSAPLAPTATAGATQKRDEVLLLTDPRLADMGWRLIGPRDALQAFAEKEALEKISLKDYHRHRISLCIPDGSHDLPVEKAFLLENNFEEMNGVDFQKGCYVGQELTARTKYRGLVRKRLYRVDISGPLPAPGTPIAAGDKDAGTFYGGIEGQGLALLRLDEIAAAAENNIPLTAAAAKLVPVRPKFVAPLV